MTQSNSPETPRLFGESRESSDALAVDLRPAGTFQETCDGALIRSELFQIVTADGIVGEIVVRLDAPMSFARTHGHVGYRILPAFRGQGFAGAALLKLREMACTPGRRLLVTCDAGNHASRKTLRNAGAILVVEDSSERTGSARLLFALDCQP